MSKPQLTTYSKAILLMHRNDYVCDRPRDNTMSALEFFKYLLISRQFLRASQLYRVYQFAIFEYCNDDNKFYVSAMRDREKWAWATCFKLNLKEIRNWNQLLNVQYLFVPYYKYEYVSEFSAVSRVFTGQIALNLICDDDDAQYHNHIIRQIQKQLNSLRCGTKSLLSSDIPQLKLNECIVYITDFSTIDDEFFDDFPTCPSVKKLGLYWPISNENDDLVPKLIRMTSFFPKLINVTYYFTVKHDIPEQFSLQQLVVWIRKECKKIDELQIANLPIPFIKLVYEFKIRKQESRKVSVLSRLPSRLLIEAVEGMGVKRAKPSRADVRPARTSQTSKGKSDKNDDGRQEKQMPTSAQHKNRKKIKSSKTEGPSGKTTTLPAVKKPNRVIGNYDRDKPSADEQRTNYVRFLKETFNIGVPGIIDLYNQELKAFVPLTATRLAFDQNMEKNRYKGNHRRMTTYVVSDVVCADQCRVVLNDGHPNGDYVHANYVNGEPLVNTFICTQGPMPNTVVDFWRMIVQEKVENIFMLCEVVEQGKTKCEQYWPRDKGVVIEFPGFMIKNLDIDTSDSTTIVCHLEVTCKAEKLLLKHHQWRTWPDKSVPQSVMAPFRLLKVARWGTGPTVIHCSAGIGRTGTVAVLELALQTVLTNKPLNVVQVIQHLRSMRMHAVQTDLQLVYVNKCLLAYASAAGLIQGNLVEVSFELNSISDFVCRNMRNSIASTTSFLRQRFSGQEQEGYTPLQPALGFGATPNVPNANSPKPHKAPTSPFFIV
ncbi:Tyrosine-protein phosphatase non-receptor type 9 [Aphelenchoides besseyi]|nr:Tyrosine-protein phosphatase non-receptor type 9 [Aphelenchoides besseyi]